MARAGMATLITQVRLLINDDYALHQATQAGDGANTVFYLPNKVNRTGGTVAVAGTIQGTASYTWDTTAGRIAFGTAPASSAAISIEYQAMQFTDDQYQTFLDNRVQLITEEPLRWDPETTSGGTLTWNRALSQYGNFEESTSGTARWVIRDSIGTEMGTANYTADYQLGHIWFTASQAGTIYYLTARSYDVYGAAADALSAWANREALAFDVTIEGNSSYSRSQKRKALQDMASDYRRQARPRTARLARTDMY